MVDKKIIFSTSNILPTNDMTTRRKFDCWLLDDWNVSKDDRKGTTDAMLITSNTELNNINKKIDRSCFLL